MTSEDESRAYHEIEKARLFDRVIGQSTKIHQRYEEIWSRVKPHWMDSRLILDIGTGPARLLGFLAQHLPRTEFIGLDIAKPMLVVAEENLRNLNLTSRVKLIHQDCVELPFENQSVSGVLSTGTYRGWPDPIATLREINRILEPKGYAYIDDVYFEADSSLTFNLYEGNRHPGYKKRFEEGMKNSPHKEDIEKVVDQANIPGLTLTFDKARFVIEISKKN